LYVKKTAERRESVTNDKTAPIRTGLDTRKRRGLHALTCTNALSAHDEFDEAIEIACHALDDDKGVNVAQRATRVTRTR